MGLGPRAKNPIPNGIRVNTHTTASTAATSPLTAGDGFLCDETFVYAAHCLALVVFCGAFLHIQVSTRLLCSSSPLLYWYAADTRRSGPLRPWIRRFYILYSLVGTVAFSKNLPWT